MASFSCRPALNTASCCPTHSSACQWEKKAIWMHPRSRSCSPSEERSTGPADDQGYLRRRWLDRPPQCHLQYVSPIETSQLHPNPDNSLSPGCQRDGRAVSPPAEELENWTDHHSLVLLGVRSALKPDLNCSAAEVVFGATVRLPGEMIWPTPRGAVEDPNNLLHRLRQLMWKLSPVPSRSSASPSYLEKDLATCSHVYLRCD
nr:unnamed protein product [Spirometra erinaceieuropaei]